MDDYIIETKQLHEGKIVTTLKEEYHKRIKDEAENVQVMKEQRIKDQKRAALNETPVVITNMRIQKLDADITDLSQKLRKSKETYKKSIADKKYILMPRIF